MSTGMTEMDQNSIFRLFYDGEPMSFETINTSRGDLDFREVIIAKAASDEKYIIKQLDNAGKFVGIYDFNLCGKEVFLNYLFREIFESDFRQELDRIFKTLRTVSKYYHFSEAEKDVALMLYRCLKPLWFNKLQKLKGLQNDMDAVKAHLNETERYLTETIDFSLYMLK